MDSQSNRASLVDLIFGKCQLVYGRDFSARWEGMQLADVKADWHRELGPLLDKPQAIKYGLENLPVDKPPTVLQFRAACLRYEAPKPRELKQPLPDRAFVVGLVEKMKRNFAGRA